MSQGRLLLLDADEYTASILADDLRNALELEVVVVDSPLKLPNILSEGEYDIALINHRLDNPNALMQGTVIKQYVESMPVIAISAPGSALRSLKDWQRQAGGIDEYLEKPLDMTKLHQVLGNRLGNSQQLRDYQNLRRLAPQGIAYGNMRHIRSGDAELAEMAIVFTDIRQSSQLISSLEPRQYLDKLNTVLRLQSDIVEKYEGEVLKYTGDGMMAIFRGMARNYMAIRCAIEIQRRIHGMNDIQIGIGITDGMVIGGFIGTDQRLHYDVIGTYVHLAARLCDMAPAGQILTTEYMYQASRIPDINTIDSGEINVRGFEQKVAYVALQPLEGDQG